MISPPKAPGQHKAKAKHRRAPSRRKSGSGSTPPSPLFQQHNDDDARGDGAEDILGLGVGSFVDSDSPRSTSTDGEPTKKSSVDSVLSPLSSNAEKQKRSRSRSPHLSLDSDSSPRNSQSNTEATLSSPSSTKNRASRSKSAYGEKENRKATTLLSPTSPNRRSRRSRSTGEPNEGDDILIGSGGKRKHRRRSKSSERKASKDDDGNDRHHRSRSHKLPEKHEKDLQLHYESRNRSSTTAQSSLRTGKGHFLALPGNDQQSTRSRRKSETLEVLSIMKLGTPMLKNGKWGFPHFRQFQLTDDASRIVWYTAGKKISKTSVALSSVSEIIYGQATDNFRRYPNAAMAHLSFSLLHTNLSKTLDLTCKSQREFDVWTKGIEKLLENEKQRLNTRDSEPLKEVHVEVTDATAVEISNVRRRTSGDFTAPRQQLDSTNGAAKQLEKERQEVMQKLKKLKLLVQKKYTITDDMRERLAKLDDDLETCAETIHAEDFGVARHVLWEVGVELESFENKVKAVYS